MGDYLTTNKQEKAIGIERRLRAEITITHDYDFNIIRHLITMGFDVETERVQTSAFDGDMHIKVYETVKYEPISEKRY
jgi:hypothetical protein